MISILLIVAAIVGMVVMVKNIDGVFKEESNTTNSGSKDDTNNSTDKDNTGSGSQGEDDDEVLKTDYYLNEATGTGYFVEGNVTYFFKKIQMEKAVLNITNIAKYSSYSLVSKWSLDLNIWENINFVKEDNSSLGYQIYEPDAEYGYLCYTTMTDCNTPLLVLEDLNQNVFFNEAYLEYNFVDALG